MTAIQDADLLAYADRLKDKVLVITGGANGIGKQTVLDAAKYGAKIVIGDRDRTGAQDVANAIVRAGGQAYAAACDVTDYAQQTDVFELAMERFGAVDIVVACAGVAELGEFQLVKTDSRGRPIPPNLKTLDIDLIGSLYTAHLAIHYLQLNRRDRSSLKSLVFLGSIASWQAIPGAPMYTASKHALFGVMRSLHPTLRLFNIRVACVQPFFADTQIVPPLVKVFLAGVPLTPVSRVASTILYTASEPSEDTNGCAWALLDDGPVVRVDEGEFKLGIYGVLDARVNALTKGLKGAIYVQRIFQDLFRLLAKPVVILVLCILIALYVRKGL
ncbi:hypothetical protein BD626DRAFT_476594 [Schizophyllum amplum]|uniref:Ketoreductase domain-containing protein n=1 Tax=Schizophyllum amplum TaxID=97359 RepID=A0A550CZH8_9AGAR|nr:hypothetical protein BD626DRAFT_476594 [Auriculariopsis ampla]